MSELFLLLDQLLGLAWIFPTSQELCINPTAAPKAMSAQAAASGPPTICLPDYSRYHSPGCHFQPILCPSVPKLSHPPTTTDLLLLLSCALHSLCLTLVPQAYDQRTQPTTALSRNPPGNKVAFVGPAYSHIFLRVATTRCQQRPCLTQRPSAGPPFPLSRLCGEGPIVSSICKHQYHAILSTAASLMLAGSP